MSSLVLLWDRIRSLRAEIEKKEKDEMTFSISRGVREKEIADKKTELADLERDFTTLKFFEEIRTREVSNG
jgi:hypothetical protein